MTVLLTMLFGCGSTASSEPPLELAPTVAVEVRDESVLYPMAVTLVPDGVLYGDGPALMHLPWTAGPPREVAQVPDAVWITSIATDGDTVFFTAPGAGVYRLDVGGELVRIASASGPDCIALQDDRVWYVDGGVRFAKPRPTSPAVAPEGVVLGWMGCLVPAGDGLVYAEDRGLFRRGLPTDELATPFAHTGHLGVSLDADATHVYWGDVTSRSVLRAPVAGGPLELVATGYTFTSTLDVGGGYLTVADSASLVVVETRSLRSANLVWTGMPSGQDGMAVAGDGAHVVLAANTKAVEGEVLVGRGGVGTLTLDLESLAWKPAPSEVPLGTVWFPDGSTTPEEWGRTLQFETSHHPRVGEAVRSGELPLRVVGVTRSDEGTELARQRAAGVVAHLQQELGAALVAEASTVVDPMLSDGVELRAAAAPYAAVFDARPPAQRLTEAQARAAYWVKRSDSELDAELRAACERAVASEQGVLLAFSAPWCGDCNRVRELAAEPALHDELEHWQEVVADVGRFDRHEALREHFAVAGIAHWVALRPTSCVEPVTRWPVLRAGRFEPATNPTGPRTAPALAEWLASARGD